MQDQPVVRVAPKGLRHDPFELGFDFIDVLARGEAGPVANPEDVRVDRERLLAERRVENDVGGLAADSRQGLQLFAGARNLAAVFIDQRLAERDDVLGLGVEQADGLDCLTQPFFAESDHLLWCFHVLKQGLGRDIDAGIGCLRREYNCDQQLIGIGRFEFGRRRRIVLRQPAKEFENLVVLHSASITSRIE
jgi:hypothetical protein